MIGSFDTRLFFLINRGTANPLFDILMPFLSDHGFLLALPVLLLAGIGAYRHRPEDRSRAAQFAVLLFVVPVGMFFLADRLNDLLKIAFGRPRPCQVLEGVRLLTRCPGSFSLPSGHAIASFAFAASLFLLSRTILSSGWRWYVLVLAGTIAFSRIYLGVHYPADIVLGTVLGAGLAWSVCAPIMKRVGRNGWT